MKFTENAVEKAAADHGTVASPSSLNRARFGYPQHYRREYEHGVRFPGQLPPNYDGSYTSMFGNYRPHPTSEPAPRPARRGPANPYAAGSLTSRRFHEQINRQESSAPIASTVPDHASASAASAYGSRSGTRFVVQHPNTANDSRAAVGSAAPGGALDDYNLINKTNNSLEDYNLSFDAPKNWGQVLIMSAYIPSLEINVPVYYVLMSHKTTECYHDALSAIMRDTQYKMGVDAVVTDFEVALFSTIALFFPAAVIIGCFFHFKQALKRQLTKMRIPEDQIKYAMRPGKLDEIVALPPTELHDVGFSYVYGKLMDGMEASPYVESEVKPEQWAPFFDTYLSGVQSPLQAQRLPYESAEPPPVFCWIEQGDGYSGDEVQRVQDWPTEAPRVQESRAATERTSLDRSFADVMAVYDSDSEPLARRSTKAIKKRRKSLKRLSLNTQKNNRDARAKKRRGAA
ncbi:hypothetical protein THAOC_31845 [Thalassiosira oceanica]|uniref:MULE transposase domain-containing protein n=1 Tax=Thalassiosira oceanica TaxID=159749 RepID=K0R8G0_THAOC|nr:hypothetical protein THAOC_31845 [Thalassiosira oceanica]|eukprot:EJK49300.1 hypothetical protein THAOC_31845 [Thalassiosira oceanica]